VARYAWPAGMAAAGAAWYAADSLRHRREGGHGYRLRGEVDVREASFLRAAESLTGAPVSFGNEVTLCVQSERFAGELHEVFERDLENSERIEPAERRERPITQRARENVTKYARREL
jgi:cardiolipin synthase A/B